MENISRISAALIAGLITLACNSVTPLPQGDWTPDAHAKISTVLKDCGKASKGYDKAVKPYAVFDFDNTSIINDVEVSLETFQLLNLRYKIRPENIFQTITGRIGDIDLPICGDLTARMLAQDIAADYQILYEEYIGKFEDPQTQEAKDALAKVRETDTYKDFAAKYKVLSASIGNAYDYSVDVLWILNGLAGMTYDEITELTKESCRYFTAMDGVSEVTWESPEMGVCGKVSGTHLEGIGISNEMKSLYRTLKANGFDVYIVSASLETVVEAMACGPEFGFEMEPDHVFGLRMKETADGLFDADYSDEYIQTFKAGKTGAIKAYIAPSHGDRGPSLVAGDSNGDYNMLTDFDDMKVGLIINCGNTGNIGALAASGDPKIAVQERDLQHGKFRAE